VISCQTLNTTSIRAGYIYHKNGKGKPHKKDLPLLKNDITNIFEALIIKKLSETATRARRGCFNTSDGNERELNKHMKH
jgi:hypothetical protein